MSTSNADMYTYFFRKSISIEMFHLQVQLYYFFQNFRLHLALISGRIFFFLYKTPIIYCILAKAALLGFSRIILRMLQ